ncbi:acetyl-CoA carboxylase biotin carboxyl carrier protein [Polaromonas jejuensis]|uniref:Biotin carboxyl carrier protein of acetyl-CoA carboxylase n=1 Tax=Polaromonas jejuensis TaxID=457502 RepID=A0ABW0Q5W6_9BURK|nr:acetyl-CoA carboxylase biotin carboxyl carrier protein [Polaromonas jejuensis]
MDQQQIKALIDALAASDLSELEYSHNGETLRLVKRSALAAAPRSGGGADAARFPAVAPASSSAPSSAAAFAAASSTVSPTELAAPLYGVVHLRPSPDESPFVTAGQAVKAGQILCVIEAMKVFNEVRAEQDVTVQDVLVSSGQEVEAGQPLFRFGSASGHGAEDSHV